MDTHRCQESSRRVVGATSRRGAIGGLAAGLASGALGRVPAQAETATPAAANAEWASVESLARDAERSGGVVGVAVHGASGKLFARHRDRRFRAASTVKVPILIEAYRQSERGALSLEDRHVLRDEDLVPGSGVLGHLHPGLDLTLADIVFLMIAVSDNTATNLVLDRVGLDAVNATMQALGMRDSLLGRRMLGRLPREGEPENWATPGDYALAIQAISANQAAETASCERMLATLEQQQTIRRISRFLPDGAGIRYGTKPGDLPEVVNDVGFVTTDRGTLAIAVFCENLPDLDDAKRTIGEIARAALSLTGIVSFAPD
ncbi:MAG: serine hydrolase [Chloroflexia bacterium]|nr:serine hydrolase [Chloroflexia bacterium]